MAHEWDVLPHIMEIKERLASIEQVCKEQKEDLKEHSLKSLEMQKEVKAISSELDQARGSIKTLKWLVPSGPVLMALLFWALRASGKL